MRSKLKRGGGYLRIQGEVMYRREYKMEFLVLLKREVGRPPVFRTPRKESL